MQVLQDGLIQEFPRDLVPAVAEIVRTRFRSVVHGARFDPHDNLLIGTSEGLILGGARELAGMFPEPDSILNELLWVDEFEEDPWAGIETLPVQRMTWDEIDLRLSKRQPVRSWKWRRASRWDR
jgi:hypothetical protein